MGVQINGSEGNVIATKGTFSGDVGIGGTLTYEDVTNIDSVGLVTARSGIEIGARPGVAASISVDGNAIFSGITTVGSHMAVGGVTPETFGGGHVTLEVAGSTTSQGGVFKTATSDSAGTGSSGTEMILFTDSAKGSINVVSSDPLTFSTANTERLRITSGGLLLLGTDTTTNNIRLGNKFGVVGTTAYTGMSITNYSGTNAEHSPMLDFNRSRGTSDGSLTSVVANDKLGELIFRGSDGSDFNDAVTIRAFVDGNPSDGTDMPGRLVFSTSADGSAAPTERLRIESAGNVNIEKNLNVVGVCTANHFSSNSGTTIQRQFKYLVSTTQLLKGGSINELNGSLRIDFTPKFADSNLIMEFDTSYVSPNTTNLYYCLFYDVTNSAGVSLPGAAGSRVRCHWTKRSSPNDNNDNDHLSMKIVTPANNTTARTYTIHFGSEGAQAQFFVSTLSSSAGSTFPMNFIITEIAA